MFGDYIKMAAKAAALIAGTALIIVLFNTITIPALNISAATNYINIAYSVANHYIPMFSVIWGLGLAILGLDLAILGVKFGLIAIKWVLKVNE